MKFYLVISALLFILLLKVPFRIIRSGWIPISLFLVFTFISNLLNQHGRILFSAGPVFISYEGFGISIIRTMRLLFMIAGAKILFGYTKTDDIVNALRRLLGPLEIFRLPVKDFFHTMGLTMKCLPVLKNMATETYAEKTKNGDIKGFFNKARTVSGFLFPMVIKSIQSPEVFFENTTAVKKHD
jgi:energy-coupling factor transport system permease protein